MNLLTFHNVDHLGSDETNPTATKEQSSQSELNSDQIFYKYANFEGIGRISEPYHIKHQPDAIPVVHPPRKLPVALRNRVFDALNDMESKGIIKPVTEPTAWVNSMVVNEKRSGK